MVRFVVMAGVLAVIWGCNVAWTVEALRRGARSGLFMHLGLGLLLSIPVIELSLGALAPWRRLDSCPARLVGLALYLPSAALVVFTFLALQHRGRARDMTESSRLVSTGVFALLRQPMTLGVALWAVALVLVFQSLFSAGLAAATVVLMRLAAGAEAEYNQRKFGPAYTEYARGVPMWNILQSLFRRRPAVVVDPEVYRARMLPYTRRAFRMLPPLRHPLVLDAGCGTGVPTLELARLCDGAILAVDTDGAALQRLRERITESGLAGRVRTLLCPFTQLPPKEGPFDLIWAEGSVSVLGFVEALTALGARLHSDGFLVVHDQEGDVAAKDRSARDAGFQVLGTFVLPGSLWWKKFYRPMQAVLARAEAARPPFDLMQLRQESELVQAEPERFGSVYFILRKGPAAAGSRAFGQA